MQLAPEQPASSHSESDLQLVADLLHKDRKATADFVDRFSRPVWGFVRRRLPYAPDAVDDIVQEVFLAAWRTLDRFRGDSTLLIWLLGIARHKVDDHHRRRARECAWPDDLRLVDIPASTYSEATLNHKATQEEIERVLRFLPEHYSLILTLRYLEDRSVREVAEIIGKTEKAVERTLARARASFKERWNDDQL